MLNIFVFNVESFSMLNWKRQLLSLQFNSFRRIILADITPTNIKVRSRCFGAVRWRWRRHAQTHVGPVLYGDIVGLGNQSFRLVCGCNFVFAINERRLQPTVSDVCKLTFTWVCIQRVSACGVLLPYLLCVYNKTGSMQTRQLSY